MKFKVCKKQLPSVCLKSAFIFFLFFFLNDSILAQQKTITGRVLDANHQPVAGVTVTVQGKSGIATTTNANGEYSINAAPGEVLEFTSIGYQKRESKVGNTNALNISLSTAATSMNEVVVVGYGTMARKNLTTAVSKVDPKNVPQAANNSVAQLLFGRAPGLQAVQQSAEPGGAINLSIRGRGNPLIVVDGIVMPYQGLEPGTGGIATELNGVRRGGFAGINPADIESIEVLKDASASIYGVNASNGVILITTKKGKGGRINVSYDGSRSLVKNMKYFEPLNAAEYMRYYNQLTLDKHLLDKKMAPFGTTAPSGFVPKFSDAQIQNAGEGTDWLGLVLRDGSIDNHNISINGGTDKVVYYFSGNFFDQKGTMKSSGLRKYTGRMNMTFNFNKWISLNTNINAARNNFTNSTAGWQTGGAGTQAFGALQAAIAYPSYVPVRDSSGKFSLFQVTGNPVSLLDIRDKSTYNSLLANLSLDFKIIPNVLSARLLYGNNTEHSTRNFYVPSTTFYFQQFRTRGSLNEAKRQNQTMEATLTFKKSLKDIVSVDAVAGIGQYVNDENGFGAQGADMLDAIATDNLSSATGNIAINSYRNSNKLRSYFTRTSFDFLDRYVLSLSYRYDGYSQFFPQNKYAGFPSASLAWKLTNESFLQNVKALNLLKLRASIGVTGTAAFDAFGAFSPDPFVISFNNAGTSFIPYYQTQFDVPGLQWPKTVNKNIGLDFSILKDRISGSLDWFRDDLTRLITRANTAPLSLIPTEPINSGHQVRQGWEIGINTTNYNKGNFQWNSMINVSHVLYRWEERFANADVPNYTSIKDPVNSIYVFETNGIVQIGETAPSHQPGSAKLPGSPKIVDRNSDGKLDSADVVRFNVDPTVSIGFGNTFRYKGFDLGIMFYGQLGGTNYNLLTAWSDPAGIIAGNQSGIKEVANIWTTSNPTGTQPGVAFNESALGLLTGVDTRLSKTDFVRCRNITLGYTFNSAALNKYFKGLRLFVDVQNPFILTDYKIGDPEVQVGNVKGGAAPYPMARTYSLGVKASL